MLPCRRQWLLVVAAIGCIGCSCPKPTVPSAAASRGAASVTAGTAPQAVRAADLPEGSRAAIVEVIAPSIAIVGQEPTGDAIYGFGTVVAPSGLIVASYAAMNPDAGVTTLPSPHGGVVSVFRTIASSFYALYQGHDRCRGV